ncbi:MAG: protein-L-isoaspartate carboxylmethyltransferase [Methanomicrobiales archaeon]|jgi:tRNA (adenine57-N1/adenine58-N1)-methyltransferase|nr:protein-L-isoaspartate carboxylmethyltransferase [Methanomicrobiales archaeon]
MIEIGDRILLSNSERSFFAHVGAGTLSTDFGIIDLDALVGSNPGDQVFTPSGDVFIVHLPRPTDFFGTAKRSGAPMLPRDIGLVIGLTGMNRRDRVLDAGTGTGICAFFFSGIAASVVSYERRHEFHERACTNLKEAGATNIELICGDVREASGFFEVVHLDLLLEPSHIIHAHSVLTPGGFLAGYTPFIEQMGMLYDTASELFSEVTSYECIVREMDRSERGTRPSTRVGHSGFITIARK